MNGQDVLGDVRYALRTMRKGATTTAVIVAILALGIGANTAIFSLVDALMLRPLPVAAPSRLVTVGDPRRTGSMSTGSPRTDLLSYPLFTDLREQQDVLSGLYASGRTDRLDVLVTDESGRQGGVAEHPRGRLVSASYFQVLGVKARLGRVFAANEDRLVGGAPVVVISHAYWQERFGGSPAVLGRTLSINGAPLSIVGVAAEGFAGDIVGQRIDVWIPLVMQPAISPNHPMLDDRGICWLLVMGRLRPGVNVEAARAALVPLLERSIRDHVAADDLSAVERSFGESPVQVLPGNRGFSYYRSAYATSLLTLLAAVALVLLIVCANVANLMLARASGRTRETSVRMALGAGRMRVLRQMLTESLVMGAAGGLLGVVVASSGSRALLRLARAGASPIPLDIRLDARVLGFAAGLSLLTALVFGLAPALRGTRLQPATVLRSQGRGATGRQAGARFGKALIVAQVALSLVLLVATGLLLRSIRRIDQADLGVRRDRLVIAELDARRLGYEGSGLLAWVGTLIADLERLPGVESASFSENGLFSGTESGTSLEVPGFEPRSEDDLVVAYDDVGPRYFRTIGASLLRGRDFEEKDSENGARVAVVNQSMARFYFHGDEALGRQLVLDEKPYEIVGVVRDVEQSDVRATPGPRLYMPMAQIEEIPGVVKLEIRTSGDPQELVPSVRDTLLAAAPSSSPDVSTLSSLVRESVSQDRLLARVISFFGLVALVLASLGLYGVMAYASARRTSEFGLRMALGADRTAVTGMVLGEAMRLVGAGVVLGLLLMLPAARLLRHQLFATATFDLPSVFLAVAVLAASAAIASYRPARRAANVAPLEALREG